MKADQPLKVLFQTRPRDLLPLTGDAGARVLSAKVIELGSARRTVDLVLFLARRGERYLRHVEFESAYRSSLALRCFDYATRLVVRFRLPVLTTVVYRNQRVPRELAHRETLDGVLVHERRFEVVRLGELDPTEALALGPGGAALVGLSRAADLGVIGRASRAIRRKAPPRQQPDLLAILQVFSEGRYTARQLARVIPEEVVMESRLFDKAVSKGRAEGRLHQAREFCAEIVKRHHPGVSAQVLRAIAACSDVPRLRRWALRAPEVSSAELVRLVTAAPTPRSARRSTPRPSRRSRTVRTR